MNTLKATITRLKTSDSLTLVSLHVDTVEFCSIVIETPESVDYLSVGNEIQIVFKETEVSIATENYENISLSNKLPVVIKKITKGKILSELITHYNNIPVISIIPTHFVERKQLKIGDPVYAMIKTNEIMLIP